MYPAYYHLSIAIPQTRKLDTISITLQGSPASGFTGDLEIGMFKTGIKISISNGKIEGIHEWRPDDFCHRIGFHVPIVQRNRLARELRSSDTNPVRR